MRFVSNKLQQITDQTENWKRIFRLNYQIKQTKALVPEKRQKVKTKKKKKLTSIFTEAFFWTNHDKLKVNCQLKPALDQNLFLSFVTVKSLPGNISGILSSYLAPPINICQIYTSFNSLPFSFKSVSTTSSRCRIMARQKLVSFVALHKVFLCYFSCSLFCLTFTKALYALPSIYLVSVKFSNRYFLIVCPRNTYREGN